MPPPVSATGKAVVWEAINNWLNTNVPESLGFKYNFDQALDPATMPRIDVSEYRFFDPGDTALGGDIFPTNAGGPTQGSAQQMIVELNIRTDGAINTAALLLARQLRDYVIYAIKNSGVANESGTVLVPPIIILTTAGVTKLICRILTEVDNAIVENFFPAAPPESTVFRYQILFRVEWYEMR